MKVRTPLELIKLYWGRVWNERDPEFIREICADPIVRHDPMSVTSLSHEEQIARVRQQSTQSEPFFTHEVLLADDAYVCSVWNMFTRKGEPMKISGIEVFKAEDGRFTDCWNSSYSMTYWGRDSGAQDPLSPRPLRKPWAVGRHPTEMRAPLDLVRLYRDRVWNDGDTNLMHGIWADPIVQYEPGGLKCIDVEVQLAQIRAMQAANASLFTHEVLFADGAYVCSIWNSRDRKGEHADRSGIEVFRAEGGQLVEYWTPPENKGVWGRRGDDALPKDLPPPTLLNSTEAIDHTWLQSVFAHSGVAVPRIAMVRTRPIGHGNMSTTVQALVGYNQVVKDEPQTVVCKFNSTVPEAQALVSRFLPYTTEISAYRYFGETPPMRTPSAYFAQVSPDGLTANLVLEDLGAFCEAGDQIKGCKQEDAAAVVSELAQMHRHYWDSADLADLTWTVEKRRAVSDAPPLYAAGAAIFRERYSSVLSMEDMGTIEAFAPLVAVWMAIAPDTMTLIHSDPRVDNIMFDRREPEQVRAYILDWQCVNRGDAQFDVAYFLSGSVSPDDRRACERRLIASHAAIIAEVDPAYTEEKAIGAYARNIVSGLYTTVVASNVMPHTSHNQELLVTLARRNCAAVRDWQALKILAEAGTRGGTTFAAPAR